MNIGPHIKAINDFIAVKATLAMSTMWCVYAFIALVMIPLFFPQSNTIVMYISSSVIQLAALPMLMVGQNILSKASELRAQEDHEMIMSEFQEIKEIHEELKAFLERQAIEG